MLTIFFSALPQQMEFRQAQLVTKGLECHRLVQVFSQQFLGLDHQPASHRSAARQADAAATDDFAEQRHQGFLTQLPGQRIDTQRTFKNRRPASGNHG